MTLHHGIHCKARYFLQLPRHMIEFLSLNKQLPEFRDVGSLARSHADVTLMFTE